MKVVQLVEGRNFHVDWHFKFLVEKHEKLAQRSVRTRSVPVVDG
jgi:hypothetical protein